MRIRIRMVALCALAMAIVGCTPQSSPQSDPSTAAVIPKPSGEISVRACTPERPLLPGETLDSCGLRILDAVNARLFRPDSDTGAPQPDLAERVDTEDSQNFTVRLAQGRLFHDGTEVRARNFVSAWNWAAYGPHGMAAQTWFEPIEGASKMICPPDGSCSKDGRPTSLSGLTVIDDYTFTITMTKPVTDWRTRFSHPVFSPLPDAFFAEDEGKDAFGKLPVGAGPFRMAGNTTSEIALESFEGYTGSTPSRVSEIVLRKYDESVPDHDVDQAYNDVVANQLDFTEVIPSDHLVEGQWKKSLEGRSTVGDTKTLQVLSFVGDDPKLRDPRLRRAISMAMDRQALARQVFNDTRAPASSWVSPAVPGYQADACAELCSYNVGQARQLFDAAGGYSGQFTITVNADGGHKPWADAVCNQLKNSLELDCQVNVLPNQVAVMDALGDGELTGMVREERLLHYLSARPFLDVYESDSRQNIARYDNSAFDQAMTQAQGATSEAAANIAYRTAELKLRENPPAIPLWYASTPAGWSNRVTDVHVTPSGTLDLVAVRVD